jgi:iron complex outermembrane recepter protein
MIRKSNIVAAALLSLTATLASAQQQDTVIRLPQIVVQATRSPLRVLDAPLAVSIIRKSEFQDANGHRIDAALRAVPGVLAQSRYGGSDIRIVIRGFGARGAGDRSNAGTTRGVRILQDGFPETEPDGRTSMDLIDLAAIEQVEVVRSNASALWGNAAGGLVNFNSIPSFDASFVRFRQAIGGFGLNRQVAELGSVIGSGRIAVTVANTTTDGWRQNSQGERLLANIGVVAPLSERTQLRASLVGADNKFNIPGPLTMTQYDTDASLANATYFQRRERRWNRIGRLGVELTHGLSEATSISGMAFVNPKYLQRSERGTYRDFTRYHIGGNAIMQNSHSLGSTLKGHLTAGADEAYQDGAILFYGLTSTGERATDLRDNKREGANNIGAFLEERLSFGERFDLTLGARYDNITYYADSFINPTLNDEKSFKRLTPKVGVVYKYSPDHSFYANLGGGVEAPAGNETDPASTFGQDLVTALNPLLEPIRSTTLEVGTKHVKAYTSGLLRELSYDLALYQTNVTNEIVPYRGGRFYFTAGKAERRGAELGLRAHTAPGFGLTTAFTFSDNRYREYVVDSVHYGKAGATADYSDNKIVGVPDRFFTVAAEYVPTFFNTMGFELELQNVGDFFADDANTVTVPGYSLFNATASLRRPVRLGSSGLGVRGFVRFENIADKKYIGSAFLNPDVVSGVPVAFEPGLPRHVVVSLSLSWQR